MGSAAQELRLRKANIKVQIRNLYAEHQKCLDIFDAMDREMMEIDKKIFNLEQKLDKLKAVKPGKNQK